MNLEIRLLFVDDDPVTQTIIGRLFKRLGLVVDTASNGREAINMLEHHHYDLILLDISMPIMDGLSTARYIRKNCSEAKRNVFIVGSTGYDSEEDRQRCIRAGMDDCVAKPYDVASLFEKIKLALSTRVTFS